MKVLLINAPFWGEKKHKHPPLGLFYIAHYLRNVAEVEVVDCNIINYSLKEVITQFSPTIVGISVLTPTAIVSMELVNELKQEFPNCCYVAGGIHASSFPEEMLNAGFDLVIRGEGELTFYDIVTRFNTNSLFDIDGISYYCKTEERIVHNKNRKRILDLDSIGFPKLSLQQLKPYEYASIIASRGCYYSCYFCSSTFYWKQIVAIRSAQSIIDEIRYYLSIGQQNIYFCDDNLFSSRKIIIELCQLIINEKLRPKWIALVRIDSIDENMVALMKRAGCVGLSIGIECGNREILKAEKNLDYDKLIDNFRLLQKYNISTRTTWMIGMGKTYEDELDSLELMKVLMPNQISIHVLIPYPNTDAWKNPEKYNIQIDKDKIDYSIFTTTYSPKLLEQIHYKHLCKDQIISLISYFKSEMKKIGYSDINDKTPDYYHVIESFLDDAIVPMLF